jgi:hypothetical protein
MTSARKIESNRKNAAASTGPKSAEGKARSRENALQHGLSIPIIADPHWSAQVVALGAEIAAGAQKADCHELANQVAAAQLDLVRIRSARQQLIDMALNDPSFGTAQRKLITQIHLAADKVPESSRSGAVSETNKQPVGDERHALVLIELAGPLARLDRYERRARSRRKRAIRAFDRAMKRNRQTPVISMNC